MKIYLSGPIQHCEDIEKRDWREYAEDHLEYETLNPLRHEFIKYKDATKEECQVLVDLDKIDIMQSKVVLVNYTRPSSGTAMEILFAFNTMKKVYVIKSTEVLSPWVIAHCHKIFNSVEEAVEYINASKGALE